MEEAEEVLDPRVQGQLESLNNCTNEINLLEKQLDEANATFRSTLSELSHRLRQLSKKLGKCIEIARPYYEAKELARQAQLDCQKAAVQYQRACEDHREARETITLAESKFLHQPVGWEFDTAWQEMVNLATRRVLEAEAKKTESELEHRKRTLVFSTVEERVQLLGRQLKKAIVKSRPYFEQKSIFQNTLQNLKQRVDSLQKAVSEAKQSYSQSLHNLEMISEEIHARRKTREPGVGAEMPCLQPFDIGGSETDEDLRSVVSEDTRTQDLYENDQARRNSLPSLSQLLDIRLSLQDISPTDSSTDLQDGFVDIDLS